MEQNCKRKHGNTKTKCLEIASLIREDTREQIYEARRDNL